jgi:chromosome partitioning protein
LVPRADSLGSNRLDIPYPHLLVSVDKEGLISCAYYVNLGCLLETQGYLEEAEKYFQDLVFKTMIPRNIRLSEAPSFGKPILLYDATSTGARSYIELARELIQR